MKVYKGSDGQEYVLKQDHDNAVIQARTEQAIAKDEFYKAKFAEQNQTGTQQGYLTQNIGPVFQVQAMPNARSTVPTENSQNLLGEQTPIEELYWSIRTSLRNAILRLKDYKGVDPAEIFAKYHTNGKDTQKLTQELFDLLLDLQHQTRKPLQEDNRNLRIRLQTKERELTDERVQHNHLKQRLRNLANLVTDKGPIAKRVEDAMRDLYARPGLVREIMDEYQEVGR